MTLRAARSVPYLRSQRCMGVIRRAFREGRDRFGFRLVHYSVQGNHLHLLVEAVDRRALSRGMQGLTIRIARRLNGELGRAGEVFADRYHARSLGTPTEVRNALRYVLRSGAHHSAAPRSAPEADPCSSAACFEGWRVRSARDPVLGGVPVADTVVRAATWLLGSGWRRAGPIDAGAVPGARRPAGRRRPRGPVHRVDSIGDREPRRAFTPPA